ncbi:MAG TPA: gamma-glutamyltransferase [Hyphomicrobiaceae bacterium]|nr:gamma-glutamyltransferase [Hyphomicrobiaceae bacterium]
MLNTSKGPAARVLLRPLRAFAALGLIAALVGGSALAQRAAAPGDPEGATGVTDRRLAVAKRHMVAAANPLAASAGREMLRAGGSAVDAAIATQLVLNLVEPQSSGLGGGAFIVVWDVKSKQLRSYDGRETAPAATTANRFVVNGGVLPFDTAVGSGLSVGVPGLARVMELAHQKHGRLPWAKLFEPALKLADNGFQVSPRLSRLLNSQGAQSFAPAARAHYFDEGGRARPPGYLLKSPEFAATLRALAGGGADAFYRGPIAEAIVRAVDQAPFAKGRMTLADIAAYKARERSAVCFPYRTYKVCGMAPPSSGGLTVGMVLRLIEPLEIGKGRGAAMSGAALHLIAEAERLAYADRDRYMADPDHVPVPRGLMDDAYLAERRKLIDPARAAAKVEAGTPPGVGTNVFGKDATRENPGTSHLSIVDKDGNVVAMTTTIEAGFGSRLWAAGFLLNNELTDFSMRPIDKDGKPAANAPGPGKRPRSSMAPTIVLDASGKPVIATGSPGGSRIILYVLKSLVGIIDWELDPQAAAALPNFGSRGESFEMEARFMAHPAIAALKAKGHRISTDAMTSGTHTIVIRPGRLEGGADPRREGVALGD